MPTFRFSIRDQNTTLSENAGWIALDDDYEPMIFSRVVGTYRTAFALLLITQFDRGIRIALDRLFEG
jgi:hypothetical protein